MGDEALGVAEIVGDVDKAKRVHHAKRARLSAGDLEGHQRAAALHLALRQRRLRVARQAWVEHLGDTVLALQELRHPPRIVAVATDATLEGLQALHPDPGIERPEDRRGGTEGVSTLRSR